jgi:drug/metabolite transporter (DMT)-like permease
MWQNFRGELAALCAALIWAIASVIYTHLGRQLSPLVLNLVKGAMALVLLIATLGLQQSLFPTVSPTVLGLLLVSGAVGIGLGDTAYFAALNAIGARRTLVMESLSPPLAALLALGFLQEQLVGMAWAGIAMTIAGVLWVVLERIPRQTVDGRKGYSPALGLLWGGLAALGQASGAVMSRAALAETAIDPLWSTLVRLVAGILVLLVWVGWQPRSLVELKLLRSWRVFAIVLVTAFFSTYLGIWLQQTSLKYAPTGIAQALSATSPLFVLPITAALGERITWRVGFGVVVAMVGIWLLFARY